MVIKNPLSSFGDWNKEIGTGAERIRRIEKRVRWLWLPPIPTMDDLKEIC
jgi:hypothetical protein